MDEYTGWYVNGAGWGGSPGDRGRGSGDGSDIVYGNRHGDGWTTGYCIQIGKIQGNGYSESVTQYREDI